MHKLMVQFELVGENRITVVNLLLLRMVEERARKYFACWGVARIFTILGELSRVMPMMLSKNCDGSRSSGIVKFLLISLISFTRSRAYVRMSAVFSRSPPYTTVAL